MSCDTRVLKILECDGAEPFWAITQKQNYSSCNGNYINLYWKLVPKIIMTELFKKLRKPCFLFLVTQAEIVPQSWDALVFEDYKFLATLKKVEKPDVKILRKAAYRFTENAHFMKPLHYAWAK